MEGPMEVRIFETSSALAQTVARGLRLKLEANLNVGFATGRTMDPLYAELTTRQRPSMPLARAWMLDEYLGLPVGDQRSYASYLRDKVFTPLNYPGDLINLPRLATLGPQEAADEYEDRLRQSGGLDVQLLGIGHNGHLGLNEPGSSVNSRTRVVTIAESTRLANKDFFASLDEVPREAVTLGLGTLNEARELWLLATGNGKAQIMKRVLEGEVSEDVPATLLRHHPGLKVFLDKEAASLLKPVS